MKIVAFTMVNNESEIIESFIRYTANFVDSIVIIDNGCTDNTIEIVNRIKLEGKYDIYVFDESLEAYNQFRLDNKYLNYIIKNMQPDLILPLDADEFLTADTNPREILESLPLDRIYYINWRWYVLTGKEDFTESFIPKRITYCLEDAAWNYVTKQPVTKVIIPAKYYRDMGLTMAMGHHHVYGNDQARIEHRTDLELGHYRICSADQLVYKTSCYTMRDIATMTINIETAQRTNQMAEIEKAGNVQEMAIEASYTGYSGEIFACPLNLQFCTPDTTQMRYAALSGESIANRIMQTGREMAIKVYNLERKNKPNSILFWLDHVTEDRYDFPSASRRLLKLSVLYNANGFVTSNPKVSFLKQGYKLIVMPKFAKFIPHKYIVITDAENYESIKTYLVENGIQKETILSLAQYEKQLGVKKYLYSFRLLRHYSSRAAALFRSEGLRGVLQRLKK